MTQVKKLLQCLKSRDVSIASQGTVCDGHISLCCHVSLQPDPRRSSAAFAIAAACAYEEQFVFTCQRGEFKHWEIFFLASKAEAKQDTMCGPCSHLVFYFWTWEGRSSVFCMFLWQRRWCHSGQHCSPREEGTWKFLRMDVHCWDEDLGRS